ncbi:MAG: pseudouridine synthase [Rikenellaceae bacterium]
METNEKLHFFTKDISNISIPEKFTYPHNYIPHKLSVLATEQVQSYINTHSELKDELSQGKMLGVLVVRTKSGNLGFLTGFSGLLMGKNDLEYFVPPVYDPQNPSGYFKINESVVSGLSVQLESLERDSDYLLKTKKVEDVIESWSTKVKNAQTAYKENKKRRKALRENCNDNEILAKLASESQFQKAELSRLKQQAESEISEVKKTIESQQNLIEQLKKDRKEKSYALQQWLLEQFVILNARGEDKNLLDLFANTALRVPPSGAGECAAPKLLQYAFVHKFEPICMAEFWYGDSPVGTVRKHGNYYPACKGKCEPILNFMLQGLNVEPNPLENIGCDCLDLEIMYKDDYLMVINKPEGLLSAPGKSSDTSVLSILKEKYPELTSPMLVHRLDMATSGLLLIALEKDVHKNLQAQFADRKVVKRYVALLDGEVKVENGIISLPLCPDLLDRPMQKVDYEDGKTAITAFQVIEYKNNCTRIQFYPKTGRTHQLRVHSAHVNGLGTPILGDNLYGKSSNRLYLHAEYLKFVHPITQKTIKITKSAPF